MTLLNLTNCDQRIYIYIYNFFCFDIDDVLRMPIGKNNALHGVTTETKLLF
jgi:hypothetical protein